MPLFHPLFTFSRRPPKACLKQLLDLLTIGLKASLLLLSLFSLYIILGMNNAFGRIPCSCSCILPYGNYSEQLLLNGVFILLIIKLLYNKLNI
ncbi:MauE/DoxX family redox-associated membrane protein [Olivibacter domesticus]|uniref:MauE/DoxX family redox-associated membrane protein n=1 Tax=Olivibacter domesticus TaxID=407022 RepID=UPI003613B25A